jgi:hypothetical protein
MDVSNKIDEICKSLSNTLKEKNKRYGNSALSPIDIFTSIKDSEIPEGILIRLDDKLSRIKNSDKLRENDIFDIMGYLVLICVKKNWNNFEQFLD